jgi:FKBP-type peptidyl-prolyl cis-trans isomerase (trigger factor)
VVAKKVEIVSGVQLLLDVPGEGPPAAKGDGVIFNMRIWLNRGDEVPLNAIQAQHVPERMIRTVGSQRLIDHAATLGKRQIAPGIEHGLLGMKAGGYRKIRVSPHLAYRDKGMPGLIPERALLVIEIHLREVLPALDAEADTGDEH